MYCFVLHIGIYLYDTNSKETHKSCVCFQHARTRSGRMFSRVLNVQIKHKTDASLCYFYNIDMLQHTNTKIYQIFTKLHDKISSTYSIILKWMPMYTLVSEKTYVYKGRLNNTAFNIVRVAQLVEHRTTDLRAVRSNTTVGKNFSFCILLLLTSTWQVEWSHKKEIKHDVYPMYIGAERERVIIWKKNGGGTSLQ